MLQNEDPLRFLLHSGSIGISGFDADNWMISQGLVAELPEPGCLTFCIGLSPQRGLIRLLKRSWKKLISAHSRNEPLPLFVAPPIPILTTPSISCSTAWRSKSKSIPLNDSVGSVSAELICPYPPGIPMVIPGELLDKERVEWLVEQKSLWPDQISAELRVVCK